MLDPSTHRGREREKQTQEWVQPAVPASGNDKRYAPTAAEALGAVHVNLGGRAGDYGRMIVSGAEAYKAAALSHPAGESATRRPACTATYARHGRWMQDMRSHGAVVLRRSSTFWMETWRVRTSSCSVQAGL